MGIFLFGTVERSCFFKQISLSSCNPIVIWLGVWQQEHHSIWKLHTKLVPVYIFLFLCSDSFQALLYFLLHGESRENNVVNWNCVVHGAVLTCFHASLDQQQVQRLNLYLYAILSPVHFYSQHQACCYMPIYTCFDDVIICYTGIFHSMIRCGAKSWV